MDRYFSHLAQRHHPVAGCTLSQRRHLSRRGAIRRGVVQGNCKENFMSTTQNTSSTKVPAISRSIAAAGPAGDLVQTLLKRYGCGPIQFTGPDNGLYDRHLLFDNAANLQSAGPREKFEAFA